MTNRLLPLLAAVTVFARSGHPLAAGSVAASPAMSAEPHTGVGLNLGIGSAVGLAGLTLTEAFGRFARLELGAGYGVSGYQLSFMPKIVLGWPQDHFVAGAGVSMTFPTDAYLASGHPIWLNIDALGYEHRFGSGIALSTALGVSGGLGNGKLCFPPDGCEPKFQEPVSHWWFPQARVGIAYWF